MIYYLYKKFITMFTFAKLASRFVITFCFFILSQNVNAQSRYWVGGSGNWSDASHWSSTSGGSGGASIPTSTDDVFFNASSGSSGYTITINVNASCKNMNSLGANSFTFIGSSGNFLEVASSLTFHASLTNNFAGTINFSSNSSGNMLSFANSVNLSKLSFIGLGEWTFTTNINITNNNIEHSQGTVFVNGKTISCQDYEAKTALTKTLDLSNSIFNITRYFVGNSSLSLVSTNSKINLSNNLAEIRACTNLTFNVVEFSAVSTNATNNGQVNTSNNCTFSKMKFNHHGFIYGNHTFDTIQITGGKTLSLGNGSTQVVDDLLISGSCTDYTTLKTSLLGSQATISKTVGIVALSQMKIQDINATGGATYNSTNSFDLGNNFGWNIQNGRNLYWVGGSGNWHESSHWSSASGGSGGECYPNQFDNVFIDANSLSSASKTISINNFSYPLKVKNFDCSGNDDVGAILSNSSGIYSEFYGNLIMSNKVTLSSNSYLLGTNNTILSNGFNFQSGVYLINNAQYSLLDSLSSSFTFEITNGTFHSNSHKIKASTFRIDNSSTANLGSSRMEIAVNVDQKSAATVNEAGVKIMGKGSSSISVTLYNTSIDTVILENTGFSSMNGNNNHFKLIHQLASASSFNFNSGSGNIIDKLIISGAGTLATTLNIDTLILSPAKSYTIYHVTVNDSLFAHSDCPTGQIIIHGGSSTLNSISSAKPLSVNTCSFSNFKFNSLGGTGSMTAYNSVDVLSNIGINFIPVAPRTLYWVGGTGNWSDQSHWSLSSGGPGGECLPTKTDDIFFDNNSMSSASSTVTINLLNQACRNLTFLNGAGKNLIINYANSGYYLSIKGNFQGSPQTTINGTDLLRFTKTGGSISFVQGGAILNGTSITIDSASVFTVIDSVKTFNLTINAGSFISENRNLTFTGSFTVSNAGTTIDIDSSYVRSAHVGIQDAVSMSNSNTIFHLTNTSNGSFTGGANRVIYKILFESNQANLNVSKSVIDFIETGRSSLLGTANISTGSNGTENGVTGNLDSKIKRLKLNGNATLLGYGSKFDTLVFGAGKTYQIHAFASEPDTIGVWISNSSCAIGNTTIQSNGSGVQSKLYLLQANTISYASIKDINILNASMLTASNSTNLGNNTNINFSNTPRSIYWVGGSGSWNDATHWSASSGGAGGECIPSLIDDVFFDANSFSLAGQTLTMNSGISFARNIDWTGVTNNPSWVIATGFTSLDIYGSLTLVANIGNINFNGSTTNFKGSTHTITSNSKSFGNTQAKFTSGSNYTLMDTFKVENLVTLLSGSTMIVAPGDFKVSSLSVESGATLNYNNATVLIKSNLAFTAGSNISDTNGHLIFRDGFSYGMQSFTRAFHNVSLINSVGDYKTNPGIKLNISCTNCSYNKVTLLHPAAIFNSSTIDSFILGAGYKFEFSSNNTYVINEYFSGDGNCFSASAFTDLFGPVTGNKAKINSAVPININLARIRGIDSDGSSFNASNSSDLGNNQDIVFAPITGRNLFWVGGEGIWSDASHWSLSSGGAGGECPPTHEDNVFFNATSFPLNNKFIRAYSLPLCKNMDWSGAGSKNPTLRFYESMQVYGNITTTTGITISGSNFVDAGIPLTLTGNGSKNIISGGFTFPWIDINGTGSWTLLDQLNASSLHHSKGTLNCNNQQLNISQYRADNTTIGTSATLNMSNSIFNMSGSFFVNANSNLTVNAASSIVRYASSGSFTGGSGHSYHNVEFNHITNIIGLISNSTISFNKVTMRGPGNYSGSINIDTIELSGGKTYNFQGSQSYGINTFIGSGTCSTPIILTGSGSGVNTTKFTKPSGILNIQNATITNIHAIGGATFNAYNSTGSNTTGWNIVPGITATLYWVGDEGSWGDQGHWSYSSGGPGGACLPLSSNDVVFDQNSFTDFNKTVDINIDASCKNMTWTSNNTPILTGNSTKFFKIYGSVELDSFMTSTYLGPITLEAVSSSQTFKSKGGTINAPLSMVGTGSIWTLLDSMHINNNVLHQRGTLNTNGMKLFVKKFISTGTQARSLNLGSSLIELADNGISWVINNTGLTFNAGTSTLYFSNNNVTFEPISNLTYYNVIGNKVGVIGSTNLINSTNNIFHDVTFNQDGSIQGNHMYNSIIVEGNNTLTLENNSTQTIASALVLNSGPNDSITINSSLAGSKAFFDLPPSSNCFSELIIKDNEIINGDPPHAIKSRNASNVTNWDFTNYVFYMDNDGDAYGDTTTRDTLCEIMPGYVANGSDCDDMDALEFPGQLWYLDLDGDDHGGELYVQCERPNLGFVSAELLSIEDCDDNDALEYPGQIWYMDEDMDGYAYEDSISCLRPDQGFVPSEVLGINDCDDSNMNTYPGAVEECDGLDNDCDLIIDLNDQNLRLIVRNANEQGIGSLYYIIHNCPNEDTIHFDISLSGDTIFYQNVNLSFSFPNGVLSRKVINENTLPIHLAFDMTSIPKAIDINTSVPNVNLLMEHMEISFTNSTSNTAIFLSPTATIALKQMALKSANTINVNGGGKLEVVDVLEVRE